MEANKSSETKIVPDVAGRDISDVSHLAITQSAEGEPVVDETTTEPKLSDADWFRVDL